MECGMPEVKVTAEDAGDQRERDPSAAVLPNENIIVAWQQKSSTSSLNNTIGVRLLQSDGTAITAEFFPSGAETSSESEPKIIAVDNDTFILAYSDFNSGDGVLNVVARVISLNTMNNTLSAGPEVQINASGTDTFSFDLALTDDGNVAFAYSMSTPPSSNAQVALKVTDANLVDGGSGQTIVGQNNEPTPQNVQIVANGSSVILAWSQNADSNTSVKAFGSAVTLNANGTIPAQTFTDVVLRTGTADPGNPPSVTVREFIQLADGNVLLVTTGGHITGSSVDDTDRLFGQIFSANLQTTVKAAFRIDDADSQYGINSVSAVALEGGGFLVSYSRVPASGTSSWNREVYYKTYDNTYTATGAEVNLTNNGGTLTGSGMVSGERMTGERA